MTTIESLVEAAPESLSDLTRTHIKEMRQGIATIDAEYKGEEAMDAEETKRLFQLVEGIARKCTRDAQPKKNNKNEGEEEEEKEEEKDEKPKDHPMDMKRECIMLCATFQNSAFVPRTQQNRMLKSIRQLTTKEEDTKKKADSGLKKGEVAVSAQVLKSFQEMQAAVAKINLGGDAGTSDKKKKKRKRNRRDPKKEGEQAAAGGDDAEAKNEE